MNNIKVTQAIAKNVLANIDRVCRENNIEYFIFSGTLLGAVRHGGYIPWDDDVDICMTRDNFNKFLEIAQEKLGDDFFVQTVQTDSEYDAFYVPIKVRDNHSKVKYDKEYNYHCGVFVDVFPFDYMPENRFTRKIQRQLGSLFVLGDYILREPFKNQRGIHKVLYPIYKVIEKMLSHKTRTKIAVSLLKLNGKNTKTMSYGIDTPWSIPFQEDEIFPVRDMEFDGITVMAPNKYIDILVKEYGDYNTLPKEEERVCHFKGVEVEEGFHKDILKELNNLN